MLEEPEDLIVDINAFRDIPVDAEIFSKNCMQSAALFPSSLTEFVSSRSYQDWKFKTIGIDDEKKALVEKITKATHLDRYCKCLLIVNWISYFGKKAILPNKKQLNKLLLDSSEKERITKYSQSTLHYKKILLLKMVFYYFFLF